MVGEQRQKGQSQKKVGESRRGAGHLGKRLKCHKKCVTHKHESEEQTVVAC